MRLLVEDRSTARSLRLAAVGRPLVSYDVAHEPRPGGAGCLLYEIRSAAAFPDGSPIGAADVVAAWESRLEDADLEDRWLLKPVLRNDSPSGGLRTGPLTGGNRLELCTDRETPDLAARLSHPDLWIWRESPGTTYHEGPGPFVETSANALEWNPHYQGSGPHVRRIEWVATDGRDAGLLFGLDGVDAGVLYGRTASGVDESAAGAVRVERLPALDRTYFLWMRPTARWVNDPQLRRWIAGTIDRDETVRYLFAGRGRAAWTLSGDGSASPAWEPVERRPLSASTVPRLELLYDAGDPQARRIAVRIEAILEGAGFALDLAAHSLAELRERMAGGTTQVTLLSHRPLTPDPVLALRQTFGWLDGAETALGILDRGAERRSAGDRKRSADYAEESLLIDARLVPLVRLHAWLATRQGLSIPLRPDGLPALGEARWRDE